jgi:hypothetical protein
MRITPRHVLSGDDLALLRKQAASAVTTRRLVERCQIALRATAGSDQRTDRGGAGDHAPPRFHSHFTPASASWLNMAESFFRDLTVTRVRSGVFHSLPQLIAALEKYLLQHNKEPNPYICTAQAKDILA